MIRRSQRLREIPRPPDWAEQHQTYGTQPQWVSYGLVSREDDGSPVEFHRDDGQVYVNVELQPSKSPVRCRVGSAVAGAGEGEYFPFLPGDEVLVALPGGREDGGCVIIARLNNVHDAFPMDSVAGQDPTKNAFAFRRRRTPYLEEFAGPVTFRNALTGAVLALDNKGGVTVKDGENSALQISADAISLVGPSSPDKSPDMLFQMNLTERRAMLQVDDAQLLVNASRTGDASQFTLPTGLVLALGSNQPAEHVATIESVLALLIGLLQQIAVSAGGVVNSASITAAIVTFLSSVAAGGLPLDPATTTALAAGLQVAANLPKSPPVGGVQQTPGLGALGLRTG